MSMLAGPRRKQKVINLRAKNSAWSNDCNKFGQRMLEKMGWSAGKGLGANESGIVEHVVARYKNDEKGLGFEDKNDQWTKHEDDFNALLANLSNANSNDDNIISGVSLEGKSKKSKARIHYHKFTRGKDISRYSEKDLANIFGKKSLKFEEKDEVTLNENVKTTDQVFTEKGSMEDYFKNKLTALKSKNQVTLVNIDNSEDYGNTDYGFQGFAGSTNNENDQESEHKHFGRQSFSFCSVNDDVGKESGNSTTEKELTKYLNYIKKKKKKSKIFEPECTESTQDNYANSSTENKNKKKKNKLISSNCFDSETKHIISEETQFVNKPKKKKLLDDEIIPTQTLQEIVPTKKRSKNKANIEKVKEISEISAEDASIPTKKRKQKERPKN